MDAINDSFITLDQMRVTVDTLTKNLQTIYQLSHIVDSSSRELLTIANSRIAERDNLIGTQEKLTKQQKKQINRLRATRTILGISTGVFGIIALGALILL